MTARLEISYLSEGFSPGAPVVNGAGSLNTNWDELLWSALTVGRPNRQYVFRYGASSSYEAIFRTSLVRMAIEQSGPSGRRFRRTAAAKTLDPSEKGAVNYFLGLAVCKLFAARLLDTPWLLHLDVFRPQLNPVLSGRSRPDLVGEMRGRKGWVAMECKGRLTGPDRTAKTKAKGQAQRLTTVNGQAPVLHIGAFAYFTSDVLEFCWEDPPGDSTVARPIEVESTEDTWRHYYSPVLALLRSRPRRADAVVHGDLSFVEELDLQIGIHPAVLELLELGLWNRARSLAEEVTSAQAETKYQVDGVRVVAGQSWLQRFEEE